MSVRGTQVAAIADGGSGGGSGGSIYGSMCGATSNLAVLKAALNVLKGLCNSDILLKDNDEWSKVQELIGKLAGEIDDVVDSCNASTTEMKAIDDLLK